MKFLNGSITLNVSALISEMSSADVKTKLHPQTLIGGKLKLVLADGQEITLDVNEFENVQLDTLCPETGLPILSDDINYTL
ncbi:hypothetical protein [Cytobacillus oceanisediminis]|uniref:Uncharacterized protein n=1 Tax=Cytobacillus oceanisediminis 2691 TaxID=1196031 RepID=A0A160M9W2_9BACI|nr:hypothetical protein [Cytobacillus oceanisediminis]AND39526.1 hypothetical protein A361_10405 [Cytobacillus oceanisediminis 2691]